MVLVMRVAASESVRAMARRSVPVVVSRDLVRDPDDGYAYP